MKFFWKKKNLEKTITETNLRTFTNPQKTF